MISIHFAENTLLVLFTFFVLNSIGNLTAKIPLEKYGFGLLTVLMALLAFRYPFRGFLAPYSA